MITSSATESRLTWADAPRALLRAVTDDPAAPLAVAVTGPGGHGKSALLEALARAYRPTGIEVLSTVPDPAAPVAPDAVLLIDDAHLLDEARLRTLRRLVATGWQRVVVAYRPWPRPAALVDLVGALGRERQPLLLTPFDRRRTDAFLAALPESDRRPDLAGFVTEQTGGVPRDVERLLRGLREQDGAAVVPPVPPRPVVLDFAPDLANLAPDVQRLLLALASDVPLPPDLLAAALGREQQLVDELFSAATAAGLLGADHRLTPVVRRAVVTLTPATDRAAVWRRLTELQLARAGAVLPMVRALSAAGVASDCPAPALVAAAEEALAEEPALAAELFASATAAGHPATGRQAVASALAGDLDAALRLADRLLATAPQTERAEAAVVAAVALAHRGHLGRSIELYRWSAVPASTAFAAVGALATGQPAASSTAHAADTTASPPTLHTTAARLTAQGVRDSIGGPPTAALSTLVRAAALLEPDGRAVLLPDSPAALAALTALHCGELDIAERVLDRAEAGRVGGPLMARRHRLLQAWIMMTRGRTAAAAEQLSAVATAEEPLEARDLLFATTLQVGLARRNSDLGALRLGWEHALEAIVRHPVDLFTLLPLGELAVAGARLGDLVRVEPHLRQARELLGRLGDPPLWATPLHWSALHAAILAEDPAAADAHVAVLLATADDNRYAGAVAAAAASWVDVLRGVVDPVRVEAAARGLHDAGLHWDAARLAGQAAIRTSDRRAMTTLLDCARTLQGWPAGTGSAHRARAGGPEEQVVGAVTSAPHRLSDREHEVAELVVAGLTYREIGDRLFISAKTVEHHVARMRSRLNCANRAELLALLRTVVADRSSGAATSPWPARTVP
ncbi:LuxR C-terminal-related transcriptional regulator [Micromonospora sp. NPDC050686]|uniref:helix-turn-helix transcriptional regulator n=1 Tax=Micromonospora sp. NPDC050686 TaxID=3154631 RepID=UPI0033FF891F